MKTKIFACLLSLAAAVLAVSCSSDDDYSIATGKLVSGVTTGSSDVTATTATLHATVEGDLSGVSPSSYQVAFRFGQSASAMSTTTTTLSENAFSTTIDGLMENVTYYYQAVLTLQGKVTYAGEVKTLVTTDAVVTTAAATDVTAVAATLGGSVTNLPSTGNPSTGIVFSSVNDVETVRAGLAVTSGEAASTFSQLKQGLLPGKTYYYAAYLDLGAGTVYGDVKSFTTQSHALDVDVDFVDLGLSTKWCKFNVGATKEGELGGLFGFGDVTGTNNSVDAGDYAQTDIYRTGLDLANTTYQQTTIPSAAEFAELFQSCSYVWTEKDGVSGLEFTGPNGNTLFLPAAGERTGNDISGEGALGAYMTGSINSSSPTACISYRFSQSGGNKATSATYTGLSVRPVSTAKNVKFDKSLLCHTWYLDIDEDAKTRIFLGPLYFYGTDDSWATVTNGEPVMGDSWAWTADYANNSWICEAKDYGSMTFTEDGKVVVNQGGTVTEGTYTVDEANKTITLSGAEILYLDNYRSAGTNWSNQLRILSLTETGLQIAVLRDNDPGQGPCLWSFNYVNEEVRKPSQFQPGLLFWDDNYNPNWETFVSPTVKVEAGQQYVFEVTGQRDAGKVVTLDFPGLAEAYPGAIIRIDKIEADGQEIAFDGNKFKYGKLEDGGAYRVELFNIWGAGTASDSPFGGGAKESEPALAFNSSLKITYTVVTLEGFKAGLTVCDSNWNSSWPDTSVPLVINGGFPQEYTISYDNARENGMIDLVELQGFAAAFPNAKLTLQSVSCDGTDVPFDASKILYGDLEGNGNYRIELYNTYGGSSGNSAFGEVEANGSGTDNAQLGFSSNITVVFTLDNLY